MKNLLQDVKKKLFYLIYFFLIADNDLALTSHSPTQQPVYLGDQYLPLECGFLSMLRWEIFENEIAKQGQIAYNLMYLIPKSNIESLLVQAFCDRHMLNIINLEIPQ